MASNTITPWRRFLNLLSLERKDITQIFYYSIFAGLISLSLPLGIQAIINLMQVSQVSTSWFVLIFLVILGIAFSGALQLMQLRIIENMQQRLFTRSSFELSYRFPKIQMREFGNNYPPELANRFFDTLVIQKGLSKILIDTPAAILQIIFALLLLSFYHPFFIFFGIFLALMLYLTFVNSTRRGLDTSLVESKYKYKVAHWIQEIARSIVSFKLSGNTSLALQKNDQLVSDYLNAREGHFRVLRLQFIKLIGFKVLITAGLLIIGGLLVLNQQMNIGQFVASEIVILLVINSVEKIIQGLESFYDMLTSIEKLGQVVDMKLENQEGQNPDFAEGLSLELEHVSYSTDDLTRPILEDISLYLPYRDRVLVSGPSGSGKSSLLRLLSGVITEDNTKIFANRFPLSSIYLNYYRAHIGTCFADETPFEASIRDNLSFGNPSISDDEIYRVLDLLGLWDFFRSQKDGLASILYPEGKQLSRSISRRLILARALLIKPRLLLLENVLDAFDDEEKEKIMDYLIDPTQPWTLVVVSNNEQWESKISHHIHMNQGKIISRSK